jgi:hypothetical protein
MLSVINAECHYAECHYAKCRYAECHYAKCRYTECHYADCRCILEMILIVKLREAAILMLIANIFANKLHQCT